MQYLAFEGDCQYYAGTLASPSTAKCDFLDIHEGCCLGILGCRENRVSVQAVRSRHNSYTEGERRTHGRGVILRDPCLGLHWAHGKENTPGKKSY